MNILGFDHIVLCVRDVKTTLAFYQTVLGLTAQEDRPNKWSLLFGTHKISLQDIRSAPALACNTVPGSGNFCLVTDTPIDDVVARLTSHGVDILEGPAQKQGAVGALMSVYFRDPDGNLVEVSNRLT